MATGDVGAVLGKPGEGVGSVERAAVEVGAEVAVFGPAGNVLDADAPGVGVGAGAVAQGAALGPFVEQGP
ncbi:hypothetical protein [Streptomyces sp. NPDC001020]